MRFLLCILAALLLPGCDKLTGEADRKVADAEAVGFACRISGKTPGECMTENDGYSPSNILDGWKFADEDIKSGKIDPSMSNRPASRMGDETVAPAEAPTAETTPAETPEAAPAESAEGS